MSNVATDPAQPLPPPGASTLVLKPTDSVGPFTLVRETDARTAMARGLKEYLEQLTIQWWDGRAERFSQVFETWAEAEEHVEYPSAAVYATDPMEYSGTEDAPMTPSTETDPATNTQYTRPCEPQIVLNVEVWCQDPEQRMIVVAMLEDAMFPVEWMGGFRLRLPHYHGAVATYTPVGMSYLDDSEDARRRYRKALVVIQARMPLIRVLGKGVRMQARVPITINDEAAPARVAGPAPDTKT